MKSNMLIKDMVTSDWTSQNVRTTVHAITGLAQVLMREDISGDERKSCTEILYDEARKLLSIFNLLL